MSVYAVKFRKRVGKEIRALPQQIQVAIARKLRELASEPRPHWAAQLRHLDPPAWKFRVGDYRVIYDVDDVSQTVTVVIAGGRDDVYERLKRRWPLED